MKLLLPVNEASFTDQIFCEKVTPSASLHWFSSCSESKDFESDGSDGDNEIDTDSDTKRHLQLGRFMVTNAF